MSTAKMQMIEICKALSYHSKLIIMDEPTSSLTEDECKTLFRIVERLKRNGITFISFPTRWMRSTPWLMR